MPQDRRYRPRGVERLLRQEACFGCCVCGHPIYEYHHIVPYTEQDPHYRPGDMMLLCARHHEPATRGVMPEAEQRSHKGNPHNRAHGRAAGQLISGTVPAQLDLGSSVRMIGAGSLIVVDDECLLGLGLGPRNSIELSARLYDESDALLAEIDRNEWIVRTPFPYDIDFDFQHLTVLSKPRRIRLEIDARESTIRLCGELWRSGHQVRLDNDGISWTGGGGIRELSLDGFTVAISSAEPTVRVGPQRPLPEPEKITRGRNERCWCGSGLKFKHCHGLYG